MASSMLVAFQSAEFHCSFLRRHGLQQNQEPTLQGKGTPFRTEPPGHVCLQAPGCSSLRVCSCHAVNFNRQRYSTCKAWWPCSSTEQISSFAAWRGAAQHTGSSTRRRYSGKDLEWLKVCWHRQQEELVTSTNWPGEIWRKKRQTVTNILILCISCATKVIYHAGVSNASRSSGFALGVKLFITRRNWRRAWLK